MINVAPVNLTLLLRQKQALLRAISNTASAHDVELLEGILNLLDHIHDQIDPPGGKRK